MRDVFINQECQHCGWRNTNQVSTQTFVKSQHTLIPETMESRKENVLNSFLNSILHQKYSRTDNKLNYVYLKLSSKLFSEQIFKNNL